MPYQIQCSTCGLKLLVREHSLGKKVRCSKCKTEFVAEAGLGEEVREDRGPAASHPPPDRREDARAPSRRGEEDREDEDRGGRRRERDRDRPDTRPPSRDRDEDEKEEDRPRKRRRARRSAEDKLWAPALALQIVAYAGGGLSLIFLLMSLAGVLAVTADIAEEKRSLLCALWAVFIAVWVGVVAKGAASMSSMYSYGLAVAGCVMAMVPFSVGFLGGIPVGIWGLMVLLKDDVKEAFAKSERE